jgi:uncharacterized protein with ParB-like and HNH nuclease domain
MRPIQATPKKIREIFQSKYLIPEFQRPYSWEDEQCTKLFEDLTDFFKELNATEESYYLGNIVIYKEGELWVVIDGQQRLTTLLLFIKAMYSHAKTATILEELLMGKNPLTGVVERNILKIETRVIEEDKIELEDVILRDSKDGKSRIKQNYSLLNKMLGDWFNELNSEEVNKFIFTILDNVVLLPIECDSRDDALTLFNTLNDRGLPLGDSDIFKAELFKSVMTNNQAKKELINRWNTLNKNDQIDSLFRDYMHVLRAETNDVSKEIGIRKYFTDSKRGIDFNDWNSILNALEKLNKENKQYEENNLSEIETKIENTWSLLRDIPNDYCQYPIKVFWYENAFLKDGVSILPKSKEKELNDLVIRTVKYYYLYAVAYNAVNTIKDTTYKVCRAIAHEDDYLDEYKVKYDEVFIDFERKIREYKYGRCRKGLVSLLAIINENQNPREIYNLSKWEIEHILPQKGGYNNYNGWTEEQYEEKLNTLGNFVMLEKELNIRASNEFFKKKKVEYKNSLIQDAKELVNIDDWKYEDWKLRNEEREDTLLKFFREIN